MRSLETTCLLFIKFLPIQPKFGIHYTILWSWHVMAMLVVNLLITFYKITTIWASKYHCHWKQCLLSPTHTMVNIKNTNPTPSSWEEGTRLSPLEDCLACSNGPPNSQSWLLEHHHSSDGILLLFVSSIAVHPVAIFSSCCNAQTLHVRSCTFALCSKIRVYDQE